MERMTHRNQRWIRGGLKICCICAILVPVPYSPIIAQVSDEVCRIVEDAHAKNYASWKKQTKPYLNDKFIRRTKKEITNPDQSLADAYLRGSDFGNTMSFAIDAGDKDLLNEIAPFVAFRSLQFGSATDFPSPGFSMVSQLFINSLVGRYFDTIRANYWLWRFTEDETYLNRARQFLNMQKDILEQYRQTDWEALMTDEELEKERAMLGKGGIYSGQIRHIESALRDPNNGIADTNDQLLIEEALVAKRKGQKIDPKTEARLEELREESWSRAELRDTSYPLSDPLLNPVNEDIIAIDSYVFSLASDLEENGRILAALGRLRQSLANARRILKLKAYRDSCDSYMRAYLETKAAVLFATIIETTSDIGACKSMQQEALQVRNSALKTQQEFVPLDSALLLGKYWTLLERKSFDRHYCTSKFEQSLEEK